MAEGTTRSGTGWWTTQHGFGAKNYKQEVRDNFSNAVSTLLNDAANELVVTPDKTDITRVAPTQGFTIDPYDTTWEDINRGDTYPDDLPEYGAAGIEEAFTGPELSGAGFMPPSVASPPPDASVSPELAGRNPPVPPGMEAGAGMGGGSGMGEGTTSEAVAILGLGGGEPATMGYTGEMEDRTDAGSRARIDAQRSEIPGTRRESMPQSQGPAGAPIVPENLPQGFVPEAETWEPGPTGPPPGFTDRPELKGRHPEVVEVIEEVVAEKPVGLRDIVRNLGDQVVQLIESIRGFSISPEEAGQIFGMSPDQLKDAYNNLARQQGRTIYEDPQAWLKLGAPPFASKEAGAAFAGKVPAGGPTLRPGVPEYSQWNVPLEETTQGFSARDYKAADVKGGPSPTSELRRLYPWARNLSEDVLQRAVQDPDFLRQLIEMSESGQILPFV